MRDILFRGKRTDGQWIYGGLLKVTYDGNTYNLIFADNFLFVFGEATAMEHACVDPATVGQFTGLTDKNGKKIFEGDVVKIQIADGSFRNASIDFRNGYFTNSLSTYLGGLVVIAPDCEVIGNIHDNPELLENP